MLKHLKLGARYLILLILSTIVVLSVIWLFPKRDTNKSNVDISANALEIFDYCINSAIQGVPLTEDALEDKVISKFKAQPAFAGSNFYFELDDDFECWVEIPAPFYDPTDLRERFAQLKSSEFDGRAKYCGWGSNWGGQPATVLGCTISSESNPSFSFKVSMVFFASDSAIFWLRPFLKFDTDGYVEIVE